MQQNISFTVQGLLNEVKPRAGQKEKVLISELVSSLGTDIPGHGKLKLSIRNAVPSALPSAGATWSLKGLLPPSLIPNKRWKTILYILTTFIIRREAPFSGFSKFRRIKKKILKLGEDGWLHPCISQISARPWQLPQSLTSPSGSRNIPRAKARRTESIFQAD